MGLTATVAVYLLIQLVNSGFRLAKRFQAPPFDLLMEVCVFAILNWWLGMWHEMVDVFIMKKFTRVKISQKEPSIKNDLIDRIQNLSGKLFCF